MKLFLDMMHFDTEAFRKAARETEITLIVFIFVTFVVLTIIAIKKTARSGNDGSEKEGSDRMLKVMIVLDCIFFVIASFIILDFCLFRY